MFSFFKRKALAPPTQIEVQVKILPLHNRDEPPAPAVFSRPPLCSLSTSVSLPLTSCIPT